MNRVLWDSVADPSKVLNTLLLLLVNKAPTMETFQYVEYYPVNRTLANTLSTDGILQLSSVDLFTKLFINFRVYII